MLRQSATLILLIVVLAMTGCGDSSSSAPIDSQAHSPTWIATHPEAALAAADFANCVSCHGTDLRGNATVVSCYFCHSFNTAPPFEVHPASWTNVYSDHRHFAAANGFTSCKPCHGADLTGSAAAPSCFSGSFDSQACHASGPQTVSHPLDGSYLNGAVHGPDAEQDLTVCQACHGELGGPGSNPRFDIGIDSVSSTGCEGCHGANLAHPANWGADPSATFHNQAGNIGNACTLCHGVALDGVAGGGVGTSCFDCHGVSPADYPTGCLSCHGQPPNGQDPVGDVSPNRQGQHNRAGHTIYISNTPSQTCQRCHFGAGSGTATHFDTTNPADVVIDHPDASDTISAVSDSSNTTCTGVCHFTNVIDGVFQHNGETWY